MKDCQHPPCSSAVDRRLADRASRIGSASHQRRLVSKQGAVSEVHVLHTPDAWLGWYQVQRHRSGLIALAFLTMLSVTLMLLLVMLIGLISSWSVLRPLMRCAASPLRAVTSGRCPCSAGGCAAGRAHAARHERPVELRLTRSRPLPGRLFPAAAFHPSQRRLLAREDQRPSRRKGVLQVVCCSLSISRAAAGPARGASAPPISHRPRSEAAEQDADRRVVRRGIPGDPLQRVLVFPAAVLLHQPAPEPARKHR